jgi:hypothetical protein
MLGSLFPANAAAWQATAAAGNRRLLVLFKHFEKIPAPVQYAGNLNAAIVHTIENNVLAV